MERSLSLKWVQIVKSKLPVVLVFSTFLLFGCATEQVVLLPSFDGQPSAVSVRENDHQILLDRPYAATFRLAGFVAAYQSSPDEVKERFADALSALPRRASSYTVYFVSGSGESLTPESVQEFEKVKADLALRSGGEIQVIGHTDRVGSVQVNDAISIKRAATVRELLIGAGIDPAVIEISGRGEREPLVPTDDEIAEAGNRRAEIFVR